MDLTTYERLVKTENAAQKIYWDFALKTISDFAPDVRGKSLPAGG